MRSRWLGIALVLGMVVAACGGGEPGASGESIGVQGEWTIDVYNGDGSLDQHHEFENALFNSAGLVDVVTHDYNLGGWAIELWGEPCVDGTGNPTSCRISEPGMFSPSTFDSPDLVVTDETVGIDGALKLSATTSATNDGDITRVDTSIYRCSAPDQGPTCSTLQSPGNFTNHFFDPADHISVTSGQVIQVEVTISFTAS